jgi:hypothetical protein
MYITQSIKYGDKSGKDFGCYAAELTPQACYVLKHNLNDRIYKLRIGHLGFLPLLASDTASGDPSDLCRIGDGISY